MRSILQWTVLISTTVALLESTSDAFAVLIVPSTSSSSSSSRTYGKRIPRWTQQQLSQQTTRLAASASDNGERKKRRRKKPLAVPAQDPVKVSHEVIEGDEDDDDDESDADRLTKEDLAAISEIARFEFQTDKESAMGLITISDAAETRSTTSSSSSISGNAIPLPDIKEARKKKQLEEEVARIEQEKEEQKVRIKRSDKEAFRKLLEQQPFADADDSYFEEEKYGTVSALLGERAKPFLAIPFGPLQVGHFIGALGIVLMAFVEYPGFPLTNLPTPLRDCLQGGLGTVYTINTVLALLVAIFKAPERGQPVALWVIKTFSVGGLAYDQLMQLPTLEELEKAKSVKGSRALKKNKKR